MGNLVTGCVFGSEPRWEAFSALGPGPTIRGHRHRSASLYVLDAVTYEGPYERTCLETFVVPSDLLLGQRAQAFLEHCSEVFATAGYSDFYADSSLIAFALVVAQVGGVRTFAFLADDDVIDMAVVAEPDGSGRVGLSIGDLDIIASDAAVTVTVGTSADETCGGVPRDVVDGLRQTPFVHVIEEPGRGKQDRYCRWAVQMFPEEFGDPEGLLGIGTWDPMDDLETDFVRCHYREGTAKPTLEPSSAEAASSVLDAGYEFAWGTKLRRVLVWTLWAWLGLVLFVCVGLSFWAMVEAVRS